MRPMSVVSDLREVLSQAFEDAYGCGLDLDQIEDIAKAELSAFARHSLSSPGANARSGSLSYKD
jgi:hypothetical protein